MKVEVKKVEKSWGHELWLANNEEHDYCGKILHINKGHKSSIHYHENKHETMYVLKGELELSLYEKNIVNMSFHVNLYSNSNHLQKIINTKASPGKVFIGPLTSIDTNDIKEWCSKGVIFFSFA